MAKKRTRMDELKDVIYYGPQKARAKWEIEDDFEEMSKWCAEQLKKDKSEQDTFRILDSNLDNWRF